MKFFKHFVDSHEGRSMQALMNKFGLEGYAAFFILTEICAAKLEKSSDEQYSEEHTNFSFNERVVREKLRMRSTKVELFLNYCSTLDLLQFTKVGDEFNFYFPKLLESLDRDSRRARPDRAEAAPKKKIKNKIKILEEIKKINWIEEANNCFQAVLVYQNDYAAEQWLGPSRMPYVNQIGGVKFIRALKNNDFEVKRIAERLEIAWKLLNQNQESA